MIINNREDFKENTYFKCLGIIWWLKISSKVSASRIK
jgi:hypothetical protein